MRLRDLTWWPPTLTDSRTLKVDVSPPMPATLRRCGVFSEGASKTPYLSIVVEYMGRSWHAMIHEMSEDTMRRVEAVMRGQEGKKLADLGDLEIE